MITGSLGGPCGMWNLWLVGLGAAVLAIVAAEAFRPLEGWANMSRALIWNAVIFGGLVLLFAGWALVSAGRSKQAGT
jgi:hypothetical protein